VVRETILIVEDDENIQQLVGYNLAKAGFNVLYADNGEQALASVKRELPDLMVLDIMLPSLNGFEVCKILRKDPQTRTMPIIMLTAKSEENDVTAGLDLGADDISPSRSAPRSLFPESNRSCAGGRNCPVKTEGKQKMDCSRSMILSLIRNGTK